MLAPICKWVDETLNKELSKSYKTKIQTIKNNLNKFVNIYKHGVPEDKIQYVSNKLNVKFVIRCPFDNKVPMITVEPKNENDNLIKPKQTFAFINNRFNHLENTFIVADSNTVNIDSCEEMERIFNSLNKGSFSFQKNNQIVTQINSFDRVYKLVRSNYQDVVNDFELSTGLAYCKLDIIQNEKLAEYIQSSVHYNCCIDLQEYSQEQEYVHIDMIKAYTQSQSSNYYIGFLGKIHEWRLINKDHNDVSNLQMGVYTIDQICFNNVSFDQLNKSLGCVYQDLWTYPLPELKMLVDCGVTFKIIAGAFGSTIDVNFNEQMVQSIDFDGVPYYARYCGACDSKNKYSSTYFHCSSQMASVYEIY